MKVGRVAGNVGGRPGQVDRVGDGERARTLEIQDHPFFQNQVCDRESVAAEIDVMGPGGPDVLTAMERVARREINPAAPKRRIDI